MKISNLSDSDIRSLDRVVTFKKLWVVYGKGAKVRLVVDTAEIAAYGFETLFEVE